MPTSLLSPYALISLEEFKASAGAAGAGDGRDAFLERAINRASEIIEKHLDRQVVARDDVNGITEYHTMQAGGSRIYSENLYTLEWPIRQVVSIHEDTAWPRTYGAGAQLTPSTDFELVPARGLIRRLGSGGPKCWACGSRAIRVIYKGGYAATADVSGLIKHFTLQLTARIVAESGRADASVLTMSDSMGNFTRFGPAMLTKEMVDGLYDERRHDFSATGERAA